MELFRLEYEILRDKSRWKATIVADSPLQAEKFISKLIGNPINVFSVESVCVINGISDEVIDRVISIYKSRIITEITTNKSQEIEEVKPLELKKKRGRMKKIKND